MFFDEDARGERLRRVVVEDGNGALRDDGAAVQSLVNEVDGAAAHFDAVGDGLSLRVEAGEGGEQTRMDVQDAPAKNFDEGGREHAHETGEADEFDVVCLQGGDDLAFVFGARCAPRRRRRAFDGEGCDAAFGGARESLRVRMIAEDESDACCGNAPALNRVGQRQHVRAAPGNKDGNVQDGSFKSQVSGLMSQGLKLRTWDLRLGIP